MPPELPRSDGVDVAAAAPRQAACGAALAFAVLLRLFMHYAQVVEKEDGRLGVRRFTI